MISANFPMVETNALSLGLPHGGWRKTESRPYSLDAEQLYALHTDPSVYVPELIGARILIRFVLTLVRRRKEVYATDFPYQTARIGRFPW